TPFRPTPRHPTTAQQTSGTADCSRAAPSTAAPSAPNRTPATAEREATAQAGSTAGQVERRAFQIPATVPPAPHPRSAGSTATADLLEPAPRSSRSRTAHRSSHPNRASDVPHISSRSADYTPTPGPIERLFPHPAKADAFNLVLCEPLFPAVIKLGRARALVRGHFLRVLKRAAVGEVSGDPGGAKRVASNFSRDAGHLGASADHAPGIGLVHGAVGQRIGFVAAR